MSIRPLTIEFTGLPNAGKTTLIHNLQNSLSTKGFSVKVMQEDAELVPSVIPKLTWVRNVWITFGQLQTLLECNYSDCDIILLDRGYYDALFWAKFLYLQKVCTQSESETIINILDMTNSSFKLKPDFLFVLDATVEESLKRRYAMGGKPSITNHEFLTFYKSVLHDFISSLPEPIRYVDTTNLTIEQVKNTVENLIFQIMT